MTSIDKIKKKTVARSEQPVQAPLAIFACLVSVSVSGFLGIYVTNPDQGKLVTLAEMPIRMQHEIERIQNDPHMPPQAKAIALGFLNQSRTMEVYSRSINSRRR
jgi:hypothetical protein